MSTDRNVTVVYSPDLTIPTSTGIERDNIKDMKIGDRIKVYCVPVGEGDYKDDPYITFDINDALDHLEKYHGKKFGSTVTVTCIYDEISARYAAIKKYDEGATTYQAAMGSYALKVDKGLLMAKIYGGNTTMRILNRSNLYSGDGWRLLGPRELSKYIFSDLNGTINPSVNPWKMATDNYHYSLFNTFYQSSHSITDAPFWTPTGITYTRFDGSIGWPNIDNKNNDPTWQNRDNNFTSLFLYQYVESENATNIYY